MHSLSFIGISFSTGRMISHQTRCALAASRGLRRTRYTGHLVRRSRKSYSSNASASDEEIVNIRSGSNGLLKLRVHSPSPSTAQTPLIFHIEAGLKCRPGTFVEDGSSKSDLESGYGELSLDQPAPIVPTKDFARGNYTVITVAPRWSQTEPFPVPLHDVLAAFDWMTKKFCSPTSSTAPRPIGVYGSSIGGSLATALALTESRPGRRTRISALATKDAVFDWTQVATSVPSENDCPDTVALYSARDQLFASPAGCFDAYASPILFFRTSGLNIPSSFPLGQAADDSAFRVGKSVEEAELIPPTRKSNLTFPAKGSGLRLPYTKIAVTAAKLIKATGSRREITSSASSLVASEPDQYGDGQPLVAQAEEMVRLMRRSIALHEMKDRMRVDGYDEGSEGEAMAKKRIEFVSLQDQHDDGDWAASFFQDVLH